MKTSKHSIPNRPARVYAKLFDYDEGKWSLQPISELFKSFRVAKTVSYVCHFDFPDARPICEKCAFQNDSY